MPGIFLNRAILFVGASALLSVQQSAVAKEGTLPMPVQSHTHETLERQIVAVGRYKNGLVLAPSHESFVITSLFKPEEKSREAVFGKFVENQRVSVTKDKQLFDWRGFLSYDNRVMAFEGSRLMMVEFDPDSFQELVRRSIPWDNLRPARDRGGEATSKETAAMRASFKKARLAFSGTVASGIARLPDDWIKNGKTNYFVLSRLKRYPILLVECSKAVASSCVLTRSCNLEAAKLNSETLRGIAVSPSQKAFYLGDPKQASLHKIKFNSCYDLPYQSSVKLPDKLKPLTNISVDDDERLFVTTLAPDDYNNASLFFWNKREWLF